MNEIFDAELGTWVGRANDAEMHAERTWLDRTSRLLPRPARRRPLATLGLASSVLVLVAWFLLPSRDDALMGRVLDDLAQPVAGARVEFHRHQPESEIAVTTDRSGGFRIPGCANQPISHLIVQAPGFAAASIALFIDFAKTTVVPGGRSVGDITLERAQLIAGRVVDAEGQPIAGAGVAFLSQRGRRSDLIAIEDLNHRLLGDYRAIASPRNGYCVTDDDGTFSYPWLGHGPMRVLAAAQGHGAARLEYVENRQDLTLELPKAQACTGRLCTETGAPVVGLEVSAFRFVGLSCYVQTLSARDGSFTLDHLEPDSTYLIQVRERQRTLLERQYRPADGAIGDLVIAARTSIDLAIQDSNGTPYQGKSIVLVWDRVPPAAEPRIAAQTPGLIRTFGWDVRDKAEPDGTVKLRFLPEGDLWFQVHPFTADRRPWVSFMMPAARETTVRRVVRLPSVPHPFSTVVRVVDRDGRPQPSASLTMIQAIPCVEERGMKEGCSHPALDCTFYPKTIELGADASATVEWDDQGPACVVARSEGAIGMLDLDASSATVTVVLEPPASLAGVALVHDRPAPGAMVTVWNGRAFCESTTADESGAFAFPVLPRASYHAGALLNGARIAPDAIAYLPAARKEWEGIAPKITLVSGAHGTLDVNALDTRSASITVRLSDSRQWVTLSRLDVTRPRDLFDVVGVWTRRSDGAEVRFDHLPAGTYAMEQPSSGAVCSVAEGVLPPPPTAKRVVVTVAEGEMKSVDL